MQLTCWYKTTRYEVEEGDPVLRSDHAPLHLKSVTMCYGVMVAMESDTIVPGTSTDLNTYPDTLYTVHIRYVLVHEKTTGICGM